MSLLACVFRVAAPVIFFFFPQCCYQEIRSTPLSYHKMYAAAESSCNWLLFPLLVAKKPPVVVHSVFYPVADPPGKKKYIYETNKGKSRD